MATDCLGGVFSILFLIFKQQVDVLADVAYVLVVDSWFLLRPPGSVSCDTFTPMSIWSVGVRPCDRAGLRWVCARVGYDFQRTDQAGYAARGEQKSCDGIHDVDVGGGGGGGTMMAVMPASEVQDNK
jgi:hypothetical protein